MPYDSAVPVLVDGARVRVVFFGPDVGKVEDETQAANVEAWARGRIAELNTPRAKNPIVVGQPLDLTVPPPPEPSLQEVYQHDRAIVLQDVADVSAGITDAGDATAALHLKSARDSRAAYVAG